MTIRHLHPADGFGRDDVDAAIHIRSARRCHLERRGLDSVAIAVRLLAETGEVPGWDDGIDQDIDSDDDGGWGWAA
ncbi:hypothetical protein NONI108955_36165 [Nocardia ninae]|uniref:Uncharacterized protein n=1 Tax=Nocardia ninae NBRC 108245 TaxID=1210091 RepID=A0A511MLL2_9NOCA|nr:hypothetical protein [Nocardia ninae]GEM41523.1 hypothetical protein NN4_60420 [Nocardia ninae NBRC 108245]